MRRQSPRGPEHDDVNAHNKMRCVGLVWTTRSMGFEGLETYAANDTIAVAPVVRKKETQDGQWKTPNGVREGFWGAPFQARLHS